MVVDAALLLGGEGLLVMGLRVVVVLGIDILLELRQVGQDVHPDLVVEDSDHVAGGIGIDDQRRTFKTKTQWLALPVSLIGLVTSAGLGLMLSSITAKTLNLLF